MRIIDAHVHLYTPEVAADPVAWAAARGEAHWATLCTRRRRDGRPVQTFPSVDGLLRDLDRAGVESAVLLGWYWEKPETVAEQNRFFAACARAHPDRLMAFAALHPAAGRELTLAELRRAREEGLVGLGELSPHSQGYSMEDSVFAEVLELAGEWRMPVNLHVTDPKSRPYPGRVETPLEDFARMARAHPRTTFILAHWGGRPVPTDAAGERMANVYYDTAASPLMYDADVWRRALPVLGEDRVIFGSDHPLNLYPRWDAEPDLGRFVAEARAGGAGAGTMAGNILRLLGQ